MSASLESSSIYPEAYKLKRPPSSGAQKKLAVQQQKLLSSGFPSLLERLLIECWIHAPTNPLEFLLAGLETAARGEETMFDARAASARPAGTPRPETPAEMSSAFEEQRQLITVACVEMMQEMVVAGVPDQPIPFAIEKLSALKLELSSKAFGFSVAGDDVAQSAAATRIQATQRGKQQRKENKQAGDAAVRIQATQRGKQQRKENKQAGDAAVRIQSVQRGKNARASSTAARGGSGGGAPSDTRLQWGNEWYKATRGVMITLGDPRGPALPEAMAELTADTAATLQAEFEAAKQARFTGDSRTFWLSALATFAGLDGGSGYLGRAEFRELCTQLFANLGELHGVGLGDIDEFFDRAAKFGIDDNRVSFAELVAVFEVEFDASPELAAWVTSHREAAASAVGGGGAGAEVTASPLLEWSHEWYRSTRGVMITLGDPRGPALPETEAELPADAAAALRAEFEKVKLGRFQGPQAGFWAAALRAFAAFDGGSGFLDKPGFVALCDQLFGSFGAIENLGAGSVEEFFDRAAKFGTDDDQVSFAELVAVFEVEFAASPELAAWVATVA